MCVKVKQVLSNPWAVNRKRYLFLGKKGMFFMFLGIKECACGHLKLSEKQDEVDPLRLQYKNTILSLYILFVFLTENTTCCPQGWGQGLHLWD